VTVTGPEGMAWSCQGRARGVLGKGSPPEDGERGTGGPGSGQSPELLEFREYLGNALRHRVWVLGGPVWSPGLGSMIPVGPF